MSSATPDGPYQLPREARELFAQLRREAERLHDIDLKHRAVMQILNRDKAARDGGSLVVLTHVSGDLFKHAFKDAESLADVRDAIAASDCAKYAELWKFRDGPAPDARVVTDETRGCVVLAHTPLLKVFQRDANGQYQKLAERFYTTDEVRMWLRGKYGHEEGMHWTMRVNGGYYAPSVRDVWKNGAVWLHKPVPFEAVLVYKHEFQALRGRFDTFSHLALRLHDILPEKQLRNHSVRVGPNATDERALPGYFHQVVYVHFPLDDDNDDRSSLQHTLFTAILVGPSNSWPVGRGFIDLSSLTRRLRQILTTQQFENHSVRTGPKPTDSLVTVDDVVGVDKCVYVHVPPTEDADVEA